MARKEAYLVRGPDGRMSTVTAFSARGAVNDYIRNHKPRPKKGDFVSAKPRGHGDWSDFKVT